MMKAAYEKRRAEIRKLLRQHGTNVTKNDNDPTGDGDQSPIHLNHSGKQVYRNLFAEGGDLTECAGSGALSEFARACIIGHASHVEQSLQRASSSSTTATRPQRELVRLLERRETSMRLSPILMVVSMGKTFQPQTKALQRGQVEVAKILLRFGARPDAKDVCGKTVCHYGAGQMATPTTLAIVDMCIKATESCHFFGKPLTLLGLKKEDMNGLKGVGLGYQTETGRRTVFLLEQNKPVAVKQENIQLVVHDDKGTASAPPPPRQRSKLCDIPDRLGGVCLLEVIMSGRDDVANFLLDEHNASIDVKDSDGCSARGMSMFPGADMSFSVARIVRHRIALDARAQKRADFSACAHCGILEQVGASRHSACSKCLLVCYCGRACQLAHWKLGHKQECKKIAKAPEESIVLEQPQENGIFHSTMTRQSGKLVSQSVDFKFKKPDSVAVEEKFYLKIQGNSPQEDLLIYDETRQCQFCYGPGQRGFQTLWEKVAAEPAFNGRKTYMEASFDASGNLTIYPGNTGIKKW